MLFKHTVDNLAGGKEVERVGVYSTFKRVLFTGPTLAINANESEFLGQCICEVHIHLELPVSQVDSCSGWVEGRWGVEVGPCSVLRGSSPRQNIGEIRDVVGHCIPDGITGY